MVQIQTRADQADTDQDQPDTEQANDDYDVQLNRPNNANDNIDTEDEMAANLDINNIQNDLNNNNTVDNNENTDVDGVNLDNVPDDDVNQLNNQVVDEEIRNYEKKRYVSSIEASDKILGHSRSGMSHKILAMVVHLEDRQNVVFNQRNIKGVANKEQRTMLTDFFDLNVCDPNANQFLYKDIVNIFVFASLLHHNHPGNELELWLEFKEAMSEDYQNEQHEDTKFMKALGHIRYILASFDRTLDEFNLPEPDARRDDWRHSQMTQFQDDMTAQQHADAIENLGATLNNEQR
ncbi:DNA repair and recombination mitochondrial, partial [Brachionus plicatilis]